METVAQYREIIHGLLEEYHAFLVRLTRTDVDTEILCDDLHGLYMLMQIGCRAETRVHRPLFYLRLKEGKIHMEEGWTKAGIANALMRAEQFRRLTSCWRSIPPISGARPLRLPSRDCLHLTRPQPLPSIPP